MPRGKRTQDGHIILVEKKKRSPKQRTFPQRRKSVLPRPAPLKLTLEQSTITQLVPELRSDIFNDISDGDENEGSPRKKRRIDDKTSASSVKTATEPKRMRLKKEATELGSEEDFTPIKPATAAQKKKRSARKGKQNTLTQMDSSRFSSKLLSQETRVEEDADMYNIPLTPKHPRTRSRKKSVKVLVDVEPIVRQEDPKPPVPSVSRQTWYLQTHPHPIDHSNINDCEANHGVNDENSVPERRVGDEVHPKQYLGQHGYQHNADQVFTPPRPYNKLFGNVVIADSEGEATPGSSLFAFTPRAACNQNYERSPLKAKSLNVGSFLSHRRKSPTKGADTLLDSEGVGKYLAIDEIPQLEIQSTPSDPPFGQSYQNQDDALATTDYEELVECQVQDQALDNGSTEVVQEQIRSVHAMTSYIDEDLSDTQMIKAAEPSTMDGSSIFHIEQQVTSITDLPCSISQIEQQVKNSKSQPTAARRLQLKHLNRIKLLKHNGFSSKPSPDEEEQKPTTSEENDSKDKPEKPQRKLVRVTTIQDSESESEPEILADSNDPSDNEMNGLTDEVANDNDYNIDQANQTWDPEEYNFDRFASQFARTQTQNLKAISKNRIDQLADLSAIPEDDESTSASRDMPSSQAGMGEIQVEASGTSAEDALESLKPHDRSGFGERPAIDEEYERSAEVGTDRSTSDNSGHHAIIVPSSQDNGRSDHDFDLDLEEIVARTPSPNRKHVGCLNTANGRIALLARVPSSPFYIQQAPLRPSQISTILPTQASPRQMMDDEDEKVGEEVGDEVEEGCIAAKSIMVKHEQTSSSPQNERNAHPIWSPPLLAISESIPTSPYMSPRRSQFSLDPEPLDDLDQVNDQDHEFMPFPRQKSSLQYTVRNEMSSSPLQQPPGYSPIDWKTRVPVGAETQMTLDFSLPPPPPMSSFKQNSSPQR